MSYKMVVLDLDGTLLNDEKVISEKDVSVLNKLNNNGVEILIATGRNYFMAKKLTEQISNIDPIILANNGAIVRHLSSDELLECKYLDSDTFEEIYIKGLEFDLNPVLHVNEYENGLDTIYENKDLENIYLGYVKKDDIRSKYIKFSPREIRNILSVCYLEDYDKLCSFRNIMDLKNNGRFNSICNRNIGKRALLEFLHVDGCKWRALKKYAEKKKINTAEIIAFGDDNNDIELIMNVGMGIAMKNGTKECKEASKRISKYDNNNSGISYELINLFNL